MSTSPLFVAACVVTTIATVANLSVEFVLRPQAKWVTKPLAASGFIAAAIALEAYNHVYGQRILFGLCLSFFGDVLLIPKNKTALKLGILCFLSAHLAYAYAFVGLGFEAQLAITGPVVLGLVVFGVPFAYWLSRHIPKSLSKIVYVYMLVISAMVVCALGACVATGHRSLLVGAVMFYFSDWAVALHRFHKPSFVYKMWGQPLYFASQLLLAWTTHLFVSQP
eukprot:m.104844 g.104844  ORF g.104844 m.104844 type:complete len:223 (-) comp27597_c0_seq2:131-799(-)